jgi:hypothetical protein
MLLTKTFLVAAAIAGGLLATPPAAASPQRIPEPPPGLVPRGSARSGEGHPPSVSVRNDSQVPCLFRVGVSRHDNPDT